MLRESGSVLLDGATVVSTPFPDDGDARFFAPKLYDYDWHLHAWRVEVVKRMPLEHIYAHIAHIVRTRLHQAGL